MLKRMIFWFNEADPSAAEMTGLLVKTDEIITNLEKKVVPVGLQSEALLHLKTTYEKAKKKLPLDSQGIEKQKWGELPREKRAYYFTEISSIKRALFGLDFPDMRAGFWTFGVLAVTLFLSVALYVSLHIYYSPMKHSIETNASSPAVEKLIEINSTVQIQKKIAMIRIRLNDAASKDELGQLKSDYKALSEQLSANALSFPTIKALGTLGGDIDLNKTEKGKETLNKLERGVAEDLDNPPARYLWMSGSEKWAEIAFWSLFGVLVGLMYYVSKRLKDGLFDGQEIPTIVTEVLMAPIVTFVIFFLLDKTGITEISASGEFIFVILGFAFLLGYGIRRTVGLLENLKKRLLPDP